MDYKPAITSQANQIYKPLDSELRQIRVLVLGPGTHNAVVSGSLNVISLRSSSTAPEYEAISYCWGDATAREQIKLQGLTFNAPASAAEALRYLRYKHEHRVLWIDALCINQDDIEERGSQVLIMADIYRNATLTNIWLGKDDTGLAAALKSVRQILDIVPHDVKEAGKSSLDLPDSIMRDIYDIKMPSHIDFGSLEAIYLWPWFTRQW